MEEQQKELLKTQLFFNTNRVLNDSFPVTFKYNAINNYRCSCAKCLLEIKDSNVRGGLIKVLNNVYELNAVAYCDKCNMYSLHYGIRLREDDGVIAKQHYDKTKGWVTERYHKKKSFIEKLLDL